MTKLNDTTDANELSAAVQRALALLDSETTDAIIGTQTDEYRTLIVGAQSSMTLLWMLMKSFRVQQNKNSLRGFSQAMVVILTLVHYAYALGVQRGRGETPTQG